MSLETAETPLPEPPPETSQPPESTPSAGHDVTSTTDADRMLDEESADGSEFAPTIQETTTPSDAERLEDQETSNADADTAGNDTLLAAEQNRDPERDPNQDGGPTTVVSAQDDTPRDRPAADDITSAPPDSRESNVDQETAEDLEPSPPENRTDSEQDDDTAGTNHRTEDEQPAEKQLEDDSEKEDPRTTDEPKTVEPSAETQAEDPNTADAPGSDKLSRLGESWESTSRLDRKSKEAEAVGLPHGVSVTGKEVEGASTASREDIEKAGMTVHHTPTRRDPTHHTVELPNPVTPEAARVFNEVFGRSRR